MAQKSIDADYVLQLDLDCKDCVRNVKKALSPFYGIEYMNIAVNEDKVYLKGNLEIMKVVEAVRKKTKKQTELIYPGPSNPQDKEVVVDLRVPFDCGKCVKKVRETVMKIDGVFFVEIDANNDKVTVKGYNISGEMICCKLCSKLGIYSEILPPKKVEVKPAEKKVEEKPAEKKGEGKPAEKKGEGKPAEKKGEGKPAEKKGEGKPEEKKGEGKPAEKKGEGKPAEKKGEGKPAEKKGNGKPAEKKGEGGSKPEPKKEDTKPKPNPEPEKGKGDAPPPKKEAPKQVVVSKGKEIADGDYKICVINNFYYPPPYIFSDENPNAYCSVM